METFNSNNFIKSLKERYDAVPLVGGDVAAKAIVAKVIKEHEYEPAAVLSFIHSTMGLSSTFTDKEWKNAIGKVIKMGGPVARVLKSMMEGLKDKLSYEKMFNLAASCCGENADALKNEICINNAGWKKVVEAIISKNTKGKKVEMPVEKKIKNAEPAPKKENKVEKSSAKVAKVDPRCKPVTLINETTGEKKTWPSFNACEKEIGAAHGTVSQIVSGECKSSKGWRLYTGEKNSNKKSGRSTRAKAVVMYLYDKAGKRYPYKTFSSVTEAAKATGVNHASISKAITGTYNSAGGYGWGTIDKKNEAVA